MQLRYRFRIEPNEAQRAMLARTFGCARVVFNGAIRVRDEAWKAGQKLSNTDVQRRVITDAKRNLPSVPSSVTVIREPDGHYYASFVVEREPTPLPETDRETGVDLGIARFATCAATDGTRTDVPNRKHQARKARKLVRLEREKARRRKGSANRAKTRRKVAVQHSKVTRSRRDEYHKQALTLIRDNQAVYVEDLHVAGMVRNRRLARAISDAGWGQFVSILHEKAAQYGREVVTVDRWFPSSKTCSCCGTVQESMPLHVRTWTCGCGAVHDRDFNAARNILAAGRAERRNACGAPVSPPSGVAARDEAGSIPVAA